MLEYLQAKNPGLELHHVESDAFKTYGKVISDMDFEALIREAKKIPNPAEGSSYVPAVPELEAVPVSGQIRERFFGTLPTQVGYCWGSNHLLNATEWHCCSEINVAVTPLVLLVAHLWEVEDGKLRADQFRGFYLPAGTAVEVYATTTHFCPCQVQEEGFGCVVALPVGTNINLEQPAADPVLLRTNKWVLAHRDNQTLIQRGVVAGITGINYEVKY